MTLYRDALGYTIRNARLQREKSLRDVASLAPMALGYLSEVELGRKEVSSEFLIGIADALQMSVSEIIFLTSLVMKDWEQQARDKFVIQEELEKANGI